jgi:hypothetical protein
MPIEVLSPVTRKGSKVGSAQRGESPGCRSAPGLRGDSTVPEPPKDAPPARQGSRGDSFSSLRICGQD